MEKYIVKPIHIFSNLVEVEANSEDDARHNALNKIQNDDNDDERYKNYYESTLPIDDKIKAQVEEELKNKEALEKANEEAPNIIVP
jgi:DNA-directed RNA polymerase subunit L